MRALFTTLAHATLSLAILGVGVSACSGSLGGDDGSRGIDNGGPGSGVSSKPGVQESPEQAAANLDVMQRLAPTCAGCHGDGSNKPFFSSLASFERLLVYSTRYVVPGAPDKSELIRLFQGQGTLTFKQMPLQGDSFAKLDAAGLTKITVAEVRNWISKIDPSTVVTPSDADAVPVRLMTGENIIGSLYVQLGLSDADFWSFDAEGAPERAFVENYPARNPWQIPFNPTDLGHGGTPNAAFARFGALGGTSNHNVSAAFLQNFIQTAQAWCGMAVEKGTSGVMFKDASPADVSATAEPKIRKNIGTLYYRMIGEPADDATIDAFYTKVFLAYEPKSTRAAWTAVCSTIVRDPLWLSY